MKKLICLLLVLGTVITLCSCAANPKKDVVTSKGDGTFETRVQETAAETHDPTETQAVTYTEEFYCTDESVLFRLAIDEEVTAANMPVVEVVPHYLTEEDVKRVAYVLFGDAIFYEADPWLAQNYSKGQIQEMIDRWSGYTNRDALKELLGESSDNDIATIQKWIADYTELYKTAPEENPDLLCQWTFKKDSYYMKPPEEIDPKNAEDDNDEIQAELDMDEIHYLFVASKRDKTDFKLNNIYAFPFYLFSPKGIDKAIYYRTLCKTEAPT